ncbi:MAG TPA: hypothetical protein VLX09_24470 [Stellaceae bacterium]|nr:hypothetical protein [Stellaceae bacterium]
MQAAKVADSAIVDEIEAIAKDLNAMSDAHSGDAKADDQHLIAELQEAIRKLREVVGRLERLIPLTPPDPPGFPQHS